MATTKKGCRGRKFRKRTVLEKVLLVILFVVTGCMVGLAITLAIQNMQEDIETCVLPECLEVANDILSLTDFNENPCNNFYNYSCGLWIKRAPPSGVIETRHFGLEEELDLKLKEILEDEGDVPYHFQKTRLYYNSCMDKERREMTSVTGFLQDLQSFGGYPALTKDWDSTNFNYLTVLRHMIKKGTVDFFLRVDAELDLTNNSRQLITLSQSSLGMPLQNFKVKELVSSYLDLVSLEASYLCQRSKDICGKKTLEEITEELQQSVNVERHLAEMEVPEEELEDEHDTYNVMEIADLQDKAPGINWKAVIQAFFPEVSEWDQRVMVKNPHFMEKFSEYIFNLEMSGEGRRVLANYFMYRQTMGASVHLTRALADVDYQLREAVHDRNDPWQLWKECLQFTKDSFDLSLASIYARKYFTEERKEELDKMVNNIRTALMDIVDGTQWMDDEDKSKALLKLENLHTLSGYPDGLTDDDNLNRWYFLLDIGENHYENYQHTSAFLQRQPWDFYRRPVNKQSWRFLPGPLLSSQAFYNLKNNSLFIPLGISQDRMFDEHSPKYINYARLGFIVARELTQAIDDYGAEYDDQGNWEGTQWKNKTIQAFIKRSKCMVHMFNSILVPEANRKINGTATLPDNSAESLGLAATYTAYSNAATDEPDNLLPGITLSNNQIFWVNMASMECERLPKMIDEQMWLSQDKSPSRYRISNTLSNNEDFINDFECDLGTNMNKVDEKCTLWGT